ncbi:MAG: flagellin, partial [Succinivibrio sp.]|nr:flagellin [Succinivibrio sp.]
MIVQHNMAALNTNRQLGATNTSLAKSTEKLSSGYRINRAGDDAAGLSISEKMRGQ